MKEHSKRKGLVYFDQDPAGMIEETDNGYRFVYDRDFIAKGRPISWSLPLRAEPFENRDLFSFFSGLLPEGWYLDIIGSTLKIDTTDCFGILLATCGETIGAVSVKAVE